MTSTAESMIEPFSRALDAVEAADIGAFTAIMEEIAHPDCEWSPYITVLVEGREFRGIDGLRSWASELVEAFEVSYTERELRPVGGDVLLFLSTLVYRGRASGAEATHEVGVVWEFEDGRFRRGRAYGSRDEAVAAAELAVA